MVRSCGRADEANSLLQKAVANGDSWNLPWAIEAERALGTGNPRDAHERLTQALDAAEENAETGGSSGSWCYSTGMLELALGNKDRAKQLLTKTLILPNVDMSRHLARLALAAMAAGN
jgi:Tfp pilus assembly protein PilF